jgi:Polyketide cyclase / dehydrase and lipid transport
MRSVSVTDVFHASVDAAEQRWYDTTRWPMWVDELDHVVEVDELWPKAGGRLIWQSGPAGRGRVSERVVRYEPLRGQSVEVEDTSLRGRQSVAFSPRADGEVEITLALEYEIKRRSLFTPLIDPLFIRPVIVASLRNTLSRFGTELAAASAGRIDG